MGEVCPEPGFTDGHDWRTCPLVLSGKVKPMRGLSPQAVERMGGQSAQSHSTTRSASSVVDDSRLR
jgi:hypothetical protein